MEPGTHPHPLDPAALAAETDWLGALALRLTGDPHDAADAAQDACVAALAARPPRSLRAWLRSVLENAVRQSRRSEGARRARERRVGGSAAASTPSAAEAVARAELQRTLLDAVLRLREPYRRTVVLRFYQGASAAAIARAEAVPESTVRNRLHRALAMLRADLAPRLGGDPRLTALLPVCALRRAGPAGGSSLVLGGLLVTKTVKLVAVTALLGSLGVAFHFSRPPADLPGSATPAVAAAPRGAPDGGAARNDARAPLALTRVDRPRPAPEAVVAPPLAAGTLEVLVTRGGSPVAQGWLHVRTRGRQPWLPKDPWSADDAHRAPLGADGSARVAGLSPGHYTLGVELRAGDVRQCFVTMPQETGLAVEIALGDAHLSGHVYASDGRPVAGARVSVSAGGWHGSFIAVVWTAADGSFRVEDLTAGCTGISVALSGSPWDLDAMRLLDLRPGENRWDHGRPTGLPTFRGVVRTRAGETVRGGGAFTFHRAEGGLFARGKLAEDGTFTVRLAPGTWTVGLELGVRREHLELGKVELGEHDLAQDLTVPGATLVLEVTRSGTGARVLAAQLNARHCSALPEGRSDPSAVRSAHVAADGTALVYGLSPGRWRARCTGAEAVEVLVRPADTEVRAQLELR